MQSNTEKMYAEMKPWKLFFAVALPGMISMFAMSIYTIIEGAFIGQKLGENALAAVNIAFPLVFINFSIADLIGVGASVPISIALGKGDKDEANNVFSCSIIMIFIASVIMGTVMYASAEPLCRLMGADDVLLDTSVRYLRTFALCSPLSTVFFAMDNYLRISGFVKTSMLINVSCNVATVCFLTLFLIGMDMDVVGSALASSVSMCLCSVAAMIPFLSGKTLLRFVKPKFRKSMFKEIAACGSPTFLNNIAGRVTSILINVSLMTLGAKQLGEGGGTTAVAVYSVLMYVSDMCQPLLYGMSDSLAPAVGYNRGAENYGRVKKIAKCNYIGSCVVAVVATALMFCFARPLATLFVKSGESNFLELSARAIRLFCLAYLFRWVSIATQSFLSAIEKPMQATILAVAVALVCPAVVLGAFWGFGLNGIWLNMFGASVLSAFLSVFLLSKVGREFKRKEEEKKAREEEERSEA